MTESMSMTGIIMAGVAIGTYWYKCCALLDYEQCMEFICVGYRWVKVSWKKHYHDWCGQGCRGCGRSCGKILWVVGYDCE